MPERIREARSFQQLYLCDQKTDGVSCKGEMVATGNTTPTMPPMFEHFCTVCKKRMFYSKPFPIPMTWSPVNAPLPDDWLPLIDTSMLRDPKEAAEIEERRKKLNVEMRTAAELPSRIIAPPHARKPVN